MVYYVLNSVSQYLNVANKLVDDKGILPGGALNRDNELVSVSRPCNACAWLVQK